MWVRWVHHFLIRRESFWSLNDSLNIGSWIWRKILKYRTLARHYHRKEVGNGETISFWYDKWSELGCLYMLLGLRGVVELGVPLNASVAEAWSSRQRRHHRTYILNHIKEVLQLKRHHSASHAADISLWWSKWDRYKLGFNIKNTCLLIWDTSPLVPWHKGVWFKLSTPIYSVFTWLAILNRLSTGDQMQKWNRGAHITCTLCNAWLETRDHLFFACWYSAKIWKKTSTRSA